MFTTHPIRRPTIVTALAVALLGVTLTGPAVARPTDVHEGLQTSSLAGSTSTPRQDLRSPDAMDAARQNDVELAIERYYSSYGEPEPLVAKAPAPADDDVPFVPIAVAVATALAIVAASATHLRRLRIRRRRTAGAVS